MNIYPDRQRSRVLLLGTSRYEHSGQLTELPAVHNNIYDLAAVLTDLPTSPFNRENCQIVGNPNSPKSMMQSVSRNSKEAEHVLLIYYAGHGILGWDGQLHLSVCETDTDQIAGTAVPFEWIRQAIQESPALIRTLILDCCFSGRAIGAMSNDTAALEQIAVSGTFILTSTTATRVAHSVPGEIHTAFTHELINLLTNGSTSPEEPLTVKELYRPLVAALAKRGLSTPKSSASDVSGDLVLRLPAIRETLDQIPHQSINANSTSFARGVVTPPIVYSPERQSQNDDSFTEEYPVGRSTGMKTAKKLGAIAFLAMPILLGVLAAVESLRPEQTPIIGEAASDLAVSRNGLEVYVVDIESNSVSVVDTASLELAGRIDGLSGAWAITVSPDGSKIYVSGTSGPDKPALWIINARSRTIEGEVYLPSGTYSDLVVAPDGGEIFMIDSNSKVVRVVDALGRTESRSFPALAGAREMAISPDGSTVYMANEELVASVKSSNGEMINTARVGFADSVTVSPTGRDIYAITSSGDTEDKQLVRMNVQDLKVVNTLQGDWSGLATDGLGGKIFSVMSGRLAVVSSTDWAPLGSSGIRNIRRGHAESLVASPSGDRVYGLLSSGGELIAFDTRDANPLQLQVGEG